MNEPDIARISGLPERETGYCAPSGWRAVHRPPGKALGPVDIM